MGEPISIVAKAAMPQPDAQTNLKSQTGGGRSFQDVLQNGAKQNEPANVNTQQVTSVNTERVNRAPDARIDRLQEDLMNRTNGIGAPQGQVNKADVYGELLFTNTRMGLLGEALGKMPNTQNKTNMMGRFGQLEGELKSVDSLMKSNKDFSPGELLGLQARLYQVGQHIEVMSKVVDQVTGGIKTILNTNV